MIYKQTQRKGKPGKQKLNMRKNIKQNKIQLENRKQIIIKKKK